MKEHKSRDKLAVVVGILIIILAALALMFAAAMYYKQRAGQGNEAETVKQTIKIPDITNPPASSAEEENAVSEAGQDDTSGQIIGSDQEELSGEEGSGDNSAEKTAEELPGDTQKESLAEAGGTEKVGGTEAAGTEEIGTEETGTKEIPAEEAQSSFGEEPQDTEVSTEETEPQNTKDSAQETKEEGNDKADAAEYIDEANARTLQTAGSHIRDITAMTEITAQEVREMIESYTVPVKNYLDGMERTEGDFSFAMNRRNYSAIADPIELRYGILVGNTAVRSFPTWQKLSDGTGYDDPDYLQETMLAAGEGVVLLHQSEDQIWSFVQAESYYGWIETAMIGFCSLEEMRDYVKAEPFAVVTEPVATTEGVALRMGTRLPIAGSSADTVTVRMPKADEQGNLITVEAEIGRDSVSEGYLELSEDAMVSQAKKLLGTNYGWGDSNGYMDCSSTLRAVYNCFGILLPRNTSWMPDCGLQVTDLSQMGADEKREFIASLPRGSILLINGHGMLTVGEEDGTVSMLHNVTQYKPTADAELERPMKCVITPIDICNSAGTSYLELYRYAISVDWSRINP